ncbi:MAG: indolepyruvate oxidoreductase subunit beta [Candidatus Heimdallarchaeota archaeon]|nr:indolepyruvate oxidoreductase subunit beta [Candidatus Heimdallarchaeota archaeon]MCK4769134.1 indolepyruvate oxidoreductase subunit beta [Candidatus Heimdallarchaeota archaeon]
MTEEYQMVIVGVGGQGILTISDIIAIAARKKGLHILGSEVHGMAQKGGSVITNLKIGKKLHSPTIPEGSAKVLVGIEENETLRFIKYLEPRGIAITSTTVLNPVSWKKNKKAAIEAQEKIDKNLAKFKAKIIKIDSEALAHEAGLSLAQNIVLLGALSQVEGFPLSDEELKEALKERVPKKYIEPNLKAFELGKNAIVNSN